MISSSYAAYQPQTAAFNPFPGLRTFEPAEDYLFFGRERQTDELLRKLRTTRFLSILGRSGSGKSSLVRSGLIPSLYGGGMTRAGSRWRVAIMRPGEDPLGNLAAALSEPDALGSGDGDEGLTRAFFETTLRASQRGLVECIRQSRIPASDNVLVLVDQFEELFRYKRSRRIVGRDEASAFVKLLLAARESDVPCYIAVTMRSDFIGDCMEFGTLPEVINEGIYLVPRMTRDELRLAITGPVAVGGAIMAPRLVSRLLNDVGDDPDQLPILQHALMRTWERWQSDHKPQEPLDLRHYEAIGTMHTALSRHAEECYAELDKRGKAIAEKLFKALTDKGSDPRGVRRPVPATEFGAMTGASFDEVAAVVETFRKTGRSFLMPPAGVPLREGSILDISHESLMRIWERLSEWADDEARSGQIYLNVARAAQRHEEGVAALWRDPELQLALAWRSTDRPTERWAARYAPAFPRAMAFLDASRDERDREILEKEEHRRHKLRQARILVAILSTASLVTIGLGAYAWTQKTQAIDAEYQALTDQHRAEAATLAARSALGRVQVAQAHAEEERVRAEEERLRAEKQAQRADLERRNAEKQRGIAERERLLAEQQSRVATEQGAVAVRERQTAENRTAEARAEKAKAETARTEAQQSEKEARRLGNIAFGRSLALAVPQQRDPKDKDRSALLALEAYGLDRDNGGNPQDPDFYEAMRSALDRLHPLPVMPAGDSIRAVAAAPDGHTALAAADDGRILRFDLDRGGKPTQVGRLPGAARSLAIRPAGDLLAAGGAGGEIRIFDLRKPDAPPRAVAGGSGVVSSLAFDRAGSRLAAGNLDGTVKLLDVDHDAPAVTLAGTGGKRVTAVAFSPDGKTVAAGIAQGGALLWDVAQPAAPPRAVCADLDVRSLAFGPNAAFLACGGGRGEIFNASLLSRPGTSPTPLLGHRSSVNSLAFDPGGEMILASAGSDKAVRLWYAKVKSVQPIVLPGHESWVWSVAFTPNGDWVISAGEDRTVRLWPARSRILADKLCAALAERKRELTIEEWRQLTESMPSHTPALCPAGP